MLTSQRYIEFYEKTCWSTIVLRATIHDQNEARVMEG